MTYPEAYIEFLVHFHGDRDYFECHEVLEDYWKQIEPGYRVSIWVGFIQLAVALYHHRRGNFKGANKLINKSFDILKQKKDQLHKLGIDPEQLYALISRSTFAIANNQVYKPINIPIVDPELIMICKTKCEASGYIWCAENTHDCDNIIHHHLFRDRTAIERERTLSKQLKEKHRKNPIKIS